MDLGSQNSEFLSGFLKSGLVFEACPFHEAFPDLESDT